MRAFQQYHLRDGREAPVRTSQLDLSEPPPHPDVCLHSSAAQTLPEFFSSCSVEQLAEFLTRAQPGCLDKPDPVRLVAVGAECGNALLDPGEECDCGRGEVSLLT